MIITCPACHTKFQLAPASLGSEGRHVRCSSCGERWFAEPFVEPPPIAQPPLAPSAAAPRPRRRPPRLTLCLAAALAVILLAALVVGRNEVASRVPGAAAVYQRLGLSLELPLGMEFRDLVTGRRLAAGRPVLVVSGEISNVSGQRGELPPLRVAVLDAARRELERERFDPPQRSLAPGGVARFEVELGVPPEDAIDVAVSFELEP